MTYIILELFPTPFIVTNMDGEVWKADLETAREVAENCQQGMVVPLYEKLMMDLDNIFNATHDPITERILKKYFNE